MPITTFSLQTSDEELPIKKELRYQSFINIDPVHSTSICFLNITIPNLQVFFLYRSNWNKFSSSPRFLHR